MFLFLDLNEDGLVSRDEMVEVLTLIFESTSLCVSSRVCDVIEQVFDKVTMTVIITVNDYITPLTSQGEESMDFPQFEEATKKVNTSLEVLTLGFSKKIFPPSLVIARGFMVLDLAHRNRKQPQVDRRQC